MDSWPPQTDSNYFPSADSPYWDPRLETMDPEEREQKVILPKLKAQLAYAYEHSDFYRRKWDQAGVEPRDVQSLADFENIPIITKQDLREDQTEHPPFGSNLCVSYHRLARVHGTSGTTGKPTVFGVSRGDMERIAYTHARVMWAMGIRQEDIVFIASFFSLYWGSWGALAGAERLGAVAFPFGAGVLGQTERAIEWMAAVKPTVFYGTPSYSLYIAEKARAKGLDPAKDFNFRILFFSGEPGAGVPSTRKRIQETFDAICCDSGSTGEMAPWMTNGECDQRTGMHLWQDAVFLELVHPRKKHRVPYGEEGVTVYTHLERTSQPMIRYWAGDIARWTGESCPCGRTYPRFPDGIYGRADDMFVIRGENVYPSAIENVLRSIHGFGDEFRIVITREKIMDEMILQVEPLPEVPKHARQELKRELEMRMKQAGLRSLVQMMEPGSLERTEFKARRVIDRRDLYDELAGK